MCTSLKLKHCFLILLFSTFQIVLGISQTFMASEGIISDMSGNKVDPNYFPIDVQGIPNAMNGKYGIEKVCLHIKHRRPTDLKIELISPQGTSVWISNRNGNDNTYGYLNSCFTQNGFNGPVHQSSEYFEGEYTTEGRLEFLNNGSDPNGMWLLVITDLSPGILGKLEFASILFSDNPAIGIESSCEVSNPSDCYFTREDKKLLPDLILSTSLTSENILYTGNNDDHHPNKLRFASAMANIGEGPLHIKTGDSWYCKDELTDKNTPCKDGSYPINHVLQIIYRGGGLKMEYDTLKSGIMYYDDSPGHNHYHVQNWASFKLLKKKWWSSDPKCWKVIAQSDKVSYCLFDNKICTQENGYCQFNNTTFSRANLPNYGLGEFTSCSSDFQGISVGGIDYYGMNYEGQSMDLPSDIKSGKYYLYIEVDPLDQFQESNETNNTLLIPIEIEGE